MQRLHVHVAGCLSWTDARPTDGHQPFGLWQHDMHRQIAWADQPRAALTPPRSRRSRVWTGRPATDGAIACPQNRRLVRPAAGRKRRVPFTISAARSSRAHLRAIHPALVSPLKGWVQTNPMWRQQTARSSAVISANSTEIVSAAVRIGPVECPQWRGACPDGSGAGGSTPVLGAGKILLRGTRFLDPLGPPRK